MRWIDVTTPLTPAMRVYPGDPPVVTAVVADPRRGDAARVTTLSLSVHAGTHVDAPNHVGRAGSGVESLPLDAMIGPAFVVRAAGLRRRRAVAPADLAALPRPFPRRLLFRGGMPLLEETARELARRGVMLIGTDALSIDPVGSVALPAHHALLRAGVVVLEGLRLEDARPGPCRMIALPLLIPGADGAPARVVLGFTSGSRSARRRPAPRGTRRRASGRGARRSG